MKHTLFIALLALLLNHTVALAGVKPEPFRISLVKLDNVSEALTGSQRMVELLMAYHPPEPGIIDAPCYPPELSSDILSVPAGCSIPADKKAEEYRNQAKQVQRLEEQVYDITRHPPDPGLEDNLITVRNKALAILRMVSPSMDDQKVFNAQQKLQRNLQSLIDMVDAHLGTGDTLPPDVTG